MRSSVFRAFLVAVLVVGAGCRPEPEPPSVQILEPAEGATLTDANVRVTLAARGVEIAPATDERAGTAHHHLFIDRDVTRPGDTIPSGRSGIVHLGRGQTDFIILGLTRGTHRVIAVLADRDHVPLESQATDTVTFTVMTDDDGRRR